MKPLAILFVSLVAANIAPSAFAQTPTASTTASASTGATAGPAAADQARMGADATGGPPKLVTDRPDFTESSEVVGHGVLQVETGITFEGDRVGDVTVRSIRAPSALVRVGVGSRFEVRLGGQGFLRASPSSPGPSVSGYSDVEIGAKIKLVDRGAFDMAVIPAMSVPMHDRQFSSGSYDPTVKFTWATTLPSAFGLSGNVNVARPSDGQGHFTQQSVSLSLAHDLMGGWGGYWEAYVFTPMERDTAAGWTVNTGVTRGIGQNLQLDLEVGRGVTAEAPDWFVGIGFAVRTLFSRVPR